MSIYPVNPGTMLIENPSLESLDCDLQQFGALCPVTACRAMKMPHS